MEMKSQKIEILVAISLIGFIVLSRLTAHFWNFKVVGGVALFAGAYFSRKYFAVATVFAGLLISDFVIGFYDQMFEVYFAYAIVSAVGFFLTVKSPRTKTFGATLLGACLFFLITNFAVWMNGVLYPLTFDGLIQSYTMAIPFFRNQLISDIIFTVALFEVAKAIKLPSAAPEAVRIKF